MKLKMLFKQTTCLKRLQYFNGSVGKAIRLKHYDQGKGLQFPAEVSYCSSLNIVQKDFGVFLKDKAAGA
jgi:hypothetical protein